jgi:hypothetical protein
MGTGTLREMGRTKARVMAIAKLMAMARVKAASTDQ